MHSNESTCRKSGFIGMEKVIGGSTAVGEALPPNFKFKLRRQQGKERGFGRKRSSTFIMSEESLYFLLKGSSQIQPE